MDKPRKPIIVAALIIVFGTLSPVLLAQNKQPNSPGARDITSTTGEGKILWQYNTHG